MSALARRPRLDIYSYNYAPEPTGIPHYNTSLATWLAAHGWEVTMHAGVPHYPWWRVHRDYGPERFVHGRMTETMAGVQVERVRHYVPTPPITGGKRMRLDASWCWRTWLDAFRCRRRPDVILVISPPFLGGLLGLHLGRRWRLPVVYHVQDLQIDAALDLGLAKGWLRAALIACERSILRRAQVVTTIGRAMRARLTAKEPRASAIRLLPNWSDVEPCVGRVGRVGRDGARFRAQWGIGSADVVVAYSGNLGRKQGLDLLLEAFAVLVDRPRVTFIIAGDGAERAELEARAAELTLSRLRFLPLVDDAELAEFLAAADIHCIPQRRSVAGFVLPSKLMNILAVGRPVVATADAGSDLADLISATGCGLAVPAEDPRALAAGIRTLIDDAALRAAMGERGLIYVRRFLAREVVLPRFARTLAKVARRGRR